MNNKQAKVFIRTLFNKNHIKVEDMEYTANTDIPTETYIEYNILTSKREGPNDKKYLKKPKIYRIRKKEYVKEISKLGFWYYRPCTKYDLEREVKASSITYEDIIHEIKIIGARHGEKMYETLCTSEEMTKAEDMGDFFRVPADLRDLNYSLYADKFGHRFDVPDYNSDNARMLNVEEMKQLLLTLEYVQERLAEFGIKD